MTPWLKNALKNAQKRTQSIHKDKVAVSDSKAVPLQAWSGPDGSRKLRFPDFVTMVQDGGRVVCQPYAPATFTPRKCSWYSFLLGAESSPGP